MFRLVRRVLATPSNEDDTIGMLSEFPRIQERPALIAYLHFILSRDQTGRYLFLSNSAKIDSVTKKQMCIRDRHYRIVDSRKWKYAAEALKISIKIKQYSRIFT